MIFLIVLSRPAGSLVDRRGPRLPLTIGPATAGFGFLLLGWPGITDGPRAFWVTFLPGLLLLGAGLGITAAPLSATVMASVSSSRQGLASGINGTMSRLSAVLAIALLGPVALIAFEQSLADRVKPLGLSAQTKAQLAVESSRLADARVPSGLSAETAAAISASIKLAFVDAFRLVTRVGAGLSWLGALLAAWLFQRHPSSDVGEARPH
jgi:MFS family permease